MLQCELEDGRMMYINMDRVTSISERKGGNMALGQLDPNGELKWISIKRFQIVKAGIWYK